MRLPALLLLLLPVWPLRVPAAEEAPVIRVAISRGSPSLNIKTSPRLYVREVSTGQKYMLLENSAYELRPANGGISVAGQQLSSPIELLPGEGERYVRLGKHVYKGSIFILAMKDRTLDVIERLSLEDYLYGVLPAEMSPDWPLEALRAQAVASRTYALKQMNPQQDYDVTDGVEAQVYGGINGINPKIKEAVDSTRGEVLTYRGKLITAFFHSCCGGHTASASSAWGEPVVRPLKGVRDPYCRHSSHYSWEYFVADQDLLRLVQSTGSTALKVRDIRSYRKDGSGRTVTFKVRTDKGSFLLKAADVRRRFGTFDFKSTLITRIRKVRGGYEFYGRGWGHGVGMCQDGAKVMAQRGKNYKRILHFYYPGADIKDYE